MSDSPFSDSFNEGKFYTQSSDKNNAGERFTLRVPGDWLHFASVVALSPVCPEYETVSDVARDGFAKAIKIALDKIGDPVKQSEWTSLLAMQDLLRKQTRDEREKMIVELYRDRMQQGTDYTVEEFFRDAATLRNPPNIDAMAKLAQQYNLSR